MDCGALQMGDWMYVSNLLSAKPNTQHLNQGFLSRVSIVRSDTARGRHIINAGKRVNEESFRMETDNRSYFFRTARDNFLHEVTELTEVLNADNLEFLKS